MLYLTVYYNLWYDNGNTLRQGSELKGARSSWQFGGSDGTALSNGEELHIPMYGKQPQGVSVVQRNVRLPFLLLLLLLLILQGLLLPVRLL